MEKEANGIVECSRKLLRHSVHRKEGKKFFFVQN